MKNLMKRGLAVMLAVAMCVSMLSLQAFAAEGVCDECKCAGSHLETCSKFEGSKYEKPSAEDKKEDPTQPVEHKHELDENGKCKIEGCDYKEEVKPVVKPCEHTWVNGKCKNCGQDCNHKPDPQTGKCTICGMEKADMGPVNPPQPENPCANGHELDSDGKCKNCGYIKHDKCTFDQWRGDGNGNHIRKCIIEGCGKVETEACDLTNGRCVKCGYPDGGSGDSGLDSGHVCEFKKWIPNDDGGTYDEPAGTHYAYCANNSVPGCPLESAGFKKTAACEYVTTETGKVCKDCKRVLSPVTLGPGDSDECKDGHTPATIGQPIGDYYHRVGCTVCGKTFEERCTLAELKDGQGKIVAYYCPVCGQQKPVFGSEDDCINGEAHDFKEIKNVLSEDGNSVLTTQMCEKCGFVKIQEICHAPAKVTVHYVYENGGVAAPDKTQSVIDGMDYSLASPDIPGYTPDQAVVEGKYVKDTDKGNVEFTVKYRFTGTYTLKIAYRYDHENGTTEVFDTVEKTGLKDGEEFSEPSPDKTGEGYELAAPGDAVVAGKIDKQNFEKTVDYKTITYTWTIKYVDKDDPNKELHAADVYSYTVENFSNLPEQSAKPEIDNYTCVNTTGDSRPSKSNLGNKVTYVEYAADEYTLVINYLNRANNAVVASAYSKTVHHGDPYDVESPTVEGFTVETGMGKVSGTIDAKSANASKQIVVNVYYTANPAPTEPDETESPSTSPNPSAEPSTSPNPSTPVTPNTPEDPEVPVPPENPEEPEVPVPPENPEVPVEDPEIPLVDVPEQDIPLSEEPPEEFRIEDPEIPLGDVPQTGDISLAWYATAFLSTLGLALMGLLDRRKNRES